MTRPRQVDVLVQFENDARSCDITAVELELGVLAYLWSSLSFSFSPTRSDRGDKVGKAKVN
jgi:hypothetical protein